MKAARLLDLTKAASPEGAYEPYLIGVGTATPARQVVELARTRGLRHFVHRGGLAYELEIKLAKTMISRPEKFFADPLTAVSGPAVAGGDRGFFFRGGHDANKSEFLEAFEAYVQSLSGARRVREEAMMVADELFTNGSKHAFPTRKLSLAKSRGDIEFAARSDGERLSIACSDTFGLLDPQRPLARIATCLDDGVATSIQSGPGGAGIGSFLVFNAASSYCLAVEKGRRTVVACALPVDGRAREATAAKNLHILIVDR